MRPSMHEDDTSQTHEDDTVWYNFLVSSDKSSVVEDVTVTNTLSWNIVQTDLSVLYVYLDFMHPYQIVSKQISDRNTTF